MKIYFLIAVFTASLVSCNGNIEEIPKREFDKELWKTKDNEGNYSYRAEMLDDLVYKIKLKGFSKDSVITLLGEPERTNNDYLYYDVYIRKENRVIPFQKRYLVLKLAKDNTVEWRKIKD